MSDINMLRKIVEVKSVDDTKILAQKFAKCVIEKLHTLNKGTFVCLFGDIGAGKTAFSRFLAAELGVKEKITSPSFVILNEYHSGEIPVYHFDLYRLENIGVKSILDELEQYSEGKMLTLVEWAEFSQNQIPFDRVEINIEYVFGENGSTDEKRKFEFRAFGEDNKFLIERL